MTENISEEHIRRIVEEIVQRVVDNGGTGTPQGGANGVFASIDEAVTAATRSQKALVAQTLEQRKKIVEAIRQVSRQYAEDFSRRALAETGMGRIEDKILKHKVAADATPGVEDLEAASWTGDHGLTVVEMAPYGVVGAITPSTHPVPTIVNNAICIIAAGNSLVLNVHPGSKNVSMYAVGLLNQAIVACGGPADLITAVAEPTIESANQLFEHQGIRLLLVTGGPAVAQAAMKSPKKAIVAGPGNPPVVVDETADLEKAAKDIIAGASFDNNILCLGEKQVFVVESVADQFKAFMVRHGCYELSAAQIDQLAQEAFVDDGSGEPHPNRELVGRNASVLGRRIGLQLGDELRLLVGETSAEHIFVREEQMMPLIPLIRCRDFDEAVRLAIQSEHGYKHSAMIHTMNVANMTHMGQEVDTTIFVKNGPCVAGLGLGGEGYISFSVATTTGEGITTPKTFTRFRRCALVDQLNIV